MGLKVVHYFDCWSWAHLPRVMQRPHLGSPVLRTWLGLIGACCLSACGSGGGSNCQQCGQDCCTAPEVCLTDNTGASACATPCTATTNCGAGNCCYLNSAGGNSQNYCETSCGDQCCLPGSFCILDQNGNTDCATSCSDNDQCPADAGCCTPLGSGQCTSESACLSICQPPGAFDGEVCRCNSAAECSTDCCAPAVDANGNPVGPFVCAPNDGQTYHCCNGGEACVASGACCATYAGLGSICSDACSVDSQCGAAHCLTPSDAGASCGAGGVCGP